MKLCATSTASDLVKVEGEDHPRLSEGGRGKEVRWQFSTIRKIHSQE